MLSRWHQLQVSAGDCLPSQVTSSPGDLQSEVCQISGDLQSEMCEISTDYQSVTLKLISWHLAAQSWA